jgi:hypothetical protein
MDPKESLHDFVSLASPNPSTLLNSTPVLPLPEFKPIREMPLLPSPIKSSQQDSLQSFSQGSPQQSPEISKNSPEDGPETFSQAIIRRSGLTVAFSVTFMGYDLGVLRTKDRHLYTKHIAFLDTSSVKPLIIPTTKLIALHLFDGSEISMSEINRALVFQETAILVPLALKHARKVTQHFGLEIATKSTPPDSTDLGTVEMYKFSRKLIKRSRKKLFKKGKKWAKRALGALLLFVMIALFAQLQKKHKKVFITTDDLTNINSEEPLEIE